MRFSGLRRTLLHAFAVLACTALLVGPGVAQTRKLTAVATTAMIGDAVKAVGGERVNVEVLLGQGVDPHLYKPTRADIAKMSKADMIFANGLNLEAQFWAKCPSLMKSASTAWSSEGDCLSASARAATKASTRSFGATTQPRRSEGKIVLLNVPT